MKNSTVIYPQPNYHFKQQGNIFYEADARAHGVLYKGKQHTSLYT